MAARFKSHNSIRHGGYCQTILLPGENAADLGKLFGDLIDEFSPNGALEEDIVATMARLLWRKHHIGV